MGSFKDSIKHQPKQQALVDMKDAKLAKSIKVDPQPALLSRPIHYITKARTQLLIFMIVMYAVVNHFDLFAHPTNSLISNIRMMIFVANLVIIYLGVLFLPEPSKKRGSSLFWRVVQAAAFAYALNILMWLFFSRENLQYVIHHVYD